MSAPRVFIVASLLALVGCSRTALDRTCPNGYAFDDVKGRCICSTDEGCPTGHTCEEGRCVCRSTACCPEGYEYSTDSEACVCRDSKCCPKDHRWLPDERRCICDAENCCPDGYRYDAMVKSCVCAGDDFCCTVQWDLFCTVQVVRLGCGECPGIGGDGDCCAAHGNPGCDDESVEQCVCEMDFVCCLQPWDDVCVQTASDSCGAAC